MQPGGVAVSRSLGDRGVPGVIHLPAIKSRELGPECRVLVLASDGLWDVVKDEELVALTLKYGANGASELARQLLREAKERRGSADNISILVVFLRDVIFG